MKTRVVAWVVVVGMLLGVAALGGGCGGSSGTGDAGLMCSPGQLACALGCANVASDPDNCGSCGNACMPGQVCSQNMCALSCSGGTTQCGKSCFDTKVDPANCGMCGKACGAGQACAAGMCTSQCASGQALCTGGSGAFCANTMTDNQNCGGCNTPCGVGQVCSGGMCVSGCGGATVDGGDGGNPETYCAPDGGVPYCADTTSDNANCGACGNACAAGSFCGGGSCTEPACQSILLISTVATAPAGLVAGMKASYPFCSVSYYNANSVTPTLSMLTPYQAILVFNDVSATYTDPAGLGNVVATYFDGGGRVVIALFADGGYGITGTFATNYILITPVNVPSSSDSYTGSNVAQDLDPTSPVLLGINSITGSGWHGTQVVKNGGAAIAKWASGDLLAVTGVVTDASNRKRNRVDLNILPSDISSGAWTGDGFALLRNALLYQ